MVRKKKNAKYKKKMIEIEALRKSKPREFWNFFKSKNTNKSDQIPLNIFCDFCKDLGTIFLMVQMMNHSILMNIITLICLILFIQN